MKTYNKHNPIRINLLNWIVLVILLSFSLPGNAQSENRNKLLQMIDENRTTIDSIAGYDKDIRSHILQVSQTPEALNKIEELQKKSQSQFINIIRSYDRDTQSAFYELARYPGLISDLVRNGLPSASDIDRIVVDYPVEIHETAKNYAPGYFDVLVSIDQLNNEIDTEFQEYLEPYNSKTRESVKILLAYPEIVSVLIEDINFTTQLGEVYNEDPEWTVNYIDQVAQELAEQSKQDLDAYKNQIQNDPEAYNEMLDASEKFATENNEVRYLDNSSDPDVDVTVINSYPFWFGYPYWYSSPYWRPRPIYYHTGFYRNNFGAVVFTGLPSYQFMHWQSYYHPTLFPHLSYNYYSYYENHYVNRYRDFNRPVPYHGFYRSIEANVINNPRVNNSNLRRIDQQRGANIVRQPNRMGSGPARRGGSDGYMNRGNRERSQSINSRYNRPGNNATPSQGRQRSSSIYQGNGNMRQRSANPQQRRENAGPSGQSGRFSPGRGASRVGRSTPTTRQSGRSERRESRSSNRQSGGRSGGRGR